MRYKMYSRVVSSFFNFALRINFNGPVVDTTNGNLFIAYIFVGSNFNRTTFGW